MNRPDSLALAVDATRRRPRPEGRVIATTRTRLTSVGVLALLILTTVLPAAGSGAAQTAAGGRAKADLQVTSLVVPSAVVRGEQATVRTTVKNAGRRAAARTTTRFYLSTDQKPDGRDRLLGATNLGRLLPGKSKTVSTQVAIPVGTAVRSYYVVACADATRKVRETREGNNCRPDRLSVTEPQPPPTTFPQTPDPLSVESSLQEERAVTQTAHAHEDSTITATAADGDDVHAGRPGRGAARSGADHDDSGGVGSGPPPVRGPGRRSPARAARAAAAPTRAAHDREPGRGSAGRADGVPLPRGRSRLPPLPDGCTGPGRRRGHGATQPDPLLHAGARVGHGRGSGERRRARAGPHPGTGRGRRLRVSAAGACPPAEWRRAEPGGHPAGHRSHEPVPRRRDPPADESRRDRRDAGCRGDRRGTRLVPADAAARRRGQPPARRDHGTRRTDPPQRDGAELGGLPRPRPERDPGPVPRRPARPRCWATPGRRRPRTRPSAVAGSRSGSTPGSPPPTAGAATSRTAAPRVCGTPGRRW